MPNENEIEKKETHKVILMSSFNNHNNVTLSITSYNYNNHPRRSPKIGIF